jgi:hypothetical protein
MLRLRKVKVNVPLDVTSQKGALFMVSVERTHLKECLLDNCEE